MKGKENLNKILQSILMFLSTKNKVLWSGSNWGSGTKVIEGIDDYNIIACEIYSYGNTILCHRSSSNNFVGVATTAGASVFNTCNITLTKTAQDTYSISTSSLIHSANTIHREIVTNTYGVVRIIGVEPIPEKIWGGGGCNRVIAALKRLGRRCAA